MPQVLHCDQGWNFEDTALPQTLEAFGIAKSHTTAYHLSGGGGGGGSMAEHMNRSLLQMFYCFVEKQHDWERYLPLVMCAYRTAVHASTRVTIFPHV